MALLGLNYLWRKSKHHLLYDPERGTYCHYSATVGNQAAMPLLDFCGTTHLVWWVTLVGGHAHQITKFEI